jgi:hypothetical protein
MAIVFDSDRSAEFQGFCRIGRDETEFPDGTQVGKLICVHRNQIEVKRRKAIVSVAN